MLLAAAAVLAQPARVLGHGDVAPMIRLQDGKVTARISGTPVPAAVAALGRLVDATIEWHGEAGDDRVSTEFTGLPVTDALDRILRPRSYVLVHGKGEGRNPIRRIIVLATAESSRRTIAAVPPPPPFLDPEPERLDPALEDLLADPSPDVRKQMVTNLDTLAADDAMRDAILRRLAADTDREVQESAGRARRRHGPTL